MILVKLVILIARVIVDVLDVLLRGLCWTLEWLCRGLEWVSAHLRSAPRQESVRAAPAPRQRIPDITPVLNVRPKLDNQPKELSDVDKLMITLGDKKHSDPQIRALAEQMLANSERVKPA